MLTRLLSTLLLLGTTSISNGADLWGIYQLAREHDLSYRIAQYEYEREKLYLPLAKSAFNPSVSLQASTERVRNEITTDTDQQLNIAVNMPIFDRVLRAEIRQSERRVLQSEIRFKQSEQALILRVSNHYFALLAAQDRKEVAYLDKIAIQTQLERAELWLDAGLGTITILLETQARFQQAIADEISADIEISNAKQALKQLISTSPEALAPLDKKAPLPHPEPRSIDAWIERALDNNLTLKLIDLDLQIAQQELKKQKVARIPRIELNGSHFWHDSSNSRISVGNVDSSSLNATLSWSLYNRGAIGIRSKQSMVAFQVATATFENQRRQVETNTTSAYLAVIGGINRVDALSKAIRAGNGALQAKQEEFAVGMITNIDVLDAQRDLSRSRASHLNAKYDFLIALLRLEETVGDLDSNDLGRINSWLLP